MEKLFKTVVIPCVWDRKSLIMFCLFQMSVNFIQLYGLTETSPLVTTMVPGAKNYLTAGVPIPNTELKIVDTEMKALGPNEVIVHRKCVSTK